MAKSRGVIQGQPWLPLTYKLIGLGMEVHNELGPGHREATYHDAMAAKLKTADMPFEDEPYLPIMLEDGQVVGGNSPDFVVDETAVVELKARPHGMTGDDQAQVIGYFAALPNCPVALFFNFGRPRLEYHRLLPPKTIPAYQRQKWGKK
ncbi:MAG: GxxExxY protein [Anaerolineae bacterium]|nr:GxxExxY protein [Anaerolineae bacterium]